MVEALEDQDLLVEELEDHEVGQTIFDNYIVKAQILQNTIVCLGP